MSTPVTSSPTTLTTGGQVRGTRVGAVHRYLGIPYAADPVGAARFRPPAKPDSWEGVRDCTAASPRRRRGPTSCSKAWSASSPWPPTRRAASR